jgi:Phosphotransferase enzyme family
VNRIPIRHAIAYLVTDRDDRLAAGEIDALERLGQPVLRAALPPLSARTLFFVALRVARKPALASPGALYLADTLRARGIGHVHAWDDGAARLAASMAWLEGLTFSCSDVVRPSLRRGALFVAARGDAHALSSLLELHVVAPPATVMLSLDWRALGATAVGVRWTSTRHDAAVAELVLHTAEGTEDVIVKHQRQEGALAAGARDRIRREHDALARLGRTLFGTQRVPRVLAFDEERTTIVMERARGTSLDARMTDADAFERAGAWLAAMQSATRSASDPHALLDATLRRALTEVETLAARDRVIRRHARRILAILAKGAAAPYLAGHHGDYWPGNVFVDGGHVTVIDFEGFREGLPLEDVAYFLMRTELLGRRFRVRTDELRARFLRGYGGADDARALRFFTVTKTLGTLMNHATGNVALSLPMRIWMWRMLRQALVRAVSGSD